MNKLAFSKKLKYFCWILLFIFISLFVGCLFYLRG